MKLAGWPIVYAGIVVMSIGAYFHEDIGIALISGGISLMVAGVIQVGIKELK